MLDQIIRDLGYVYSKADPYVWLKVETKPDGTEYYAYVLVYFDAVLQLHQDPDAFMNRLSEVYRLNDGRVVEPKKYLGDNIEKVQLNDGSVAWSIMSREYVTNAIQN